MSFTATSSIYRGGKNVRDLIKGIKSCHAMLALFLPWL
jgi:hypothetical protein